MLLEGVQLYVMLVQVFESSRSRRPYFYAIGYGVPALIVTATAASRPHGYGTERACWLSYEDGVIWSFLAPVIIVIAVNVGFLTLTLYKMIRHSSHVKPVSGNTGSLRSWTLGCASLLCLLGLTWTFGLLFVSRGSLPLAYLFTILNSAQGVFIFTFHCLMQKKVRKEYARFLSRFCPGLARLGDSFTSTTTTNPNSTTNSSLHSSTRGSSTRGLLMRGSKVNFSKVSDSDSSIQNSTPAERTYQARCTAESVGDSVESVGVVPG
ncbi:adhesion G protein-coupled receptor L3-like [Lampetra planeri]